MVVVLLMGLKWYEPIMNFLFFDVNETSFSMLNWKTTFVVVPTTIGSGAEISSASVMYNDALKTKEFVVSHQFIPEIIVLEASLIANAPKKILLSSMVDALSHAIEGYMSNIDNMLVDSYAEKAVQIIAQYYKVISDDIDKEHINKLQLASLFAGLVQNPLYCWCNTCFGASNVSLWPIACKCQSLFSYLR